MQRVRDKGRAGAPPAQSAREPRPGTTGEPEGREADSAFEPIFASLNGAHVVEPPVALSESQAGSRVPERGAADSLSLSGSPPVPALLTSAVQETLQVEADTHVFKVPITAYQEFCRRLAQARQELGDTVLDPQSVQLSMEGVPPGEAEILFYAAGLVPLKAAEEVLRGAPKPVPGGQASVTLPWICVSCDAAREPSRSTTFVCHSCARKLPDGGRPVAAGAAQEVVSVSHSTTFVCPSCARKLPDGGRPAAAGAAQEVVSHSTTFVCPSCARKLPDGRGPAAAGAAQEAVSVSHSTTFVCPSCARKQLPVAEAELSESTFFCTISQKHQPLAQADPRESSVSWTTCQEHRAQAKSEEQPSVCTACVLVQQPQAEPSQSWTVCTVCQHVQQQQPPAQAEPSQSWTVCTVCQHVQQQQPPAQAEPSQSWTVCTACGLAQQQPVEAEPSQPASVCTVCWHVQQAQPVCGPPPAQRTGGAAAPPAYAPGPSAPPAYVPSLSNYYSYWAQQLAC
eukprot:g75418.t1